MERKKKNSASAALPAVMALIYFLGVKTLFSPCGPKEDGSFMHCHDAGTLLGILALAMLALSAARCLKEGKKGTMLLSGAVILLAAAAAFVPGHVIALCMMPEMRCRMMMQPFSAVMSWLTGLSAAADLLLQYRRKDSNRHEL